MRAECGFLCPVCVAVNKGGRLGAQHGGVGSRQQPESGSQGVSVCLAGPWAVCVLPCAGWPVRVGLEHVCLRKRPVML